MKCSFDDVGREWSFMKESRERKRGRGRECTVIFNILIQQHKGERHIFIAIGTTSVIHTVFLILRIVAHYSLIHLHFITRPFKLSPIVHSIF